MRHQEIVAVARKRDRSGERHHVKRGMDPVVRGGDDVDQAPAHIRHVELATRFIERDIGGRAANGENRAEYRRGRFLAAAGIRTAPASTARSEAMKGARRRR